MPNKKIKKDQQPHDKINMTVRMERSLRENFLAIAKGQDEDASKLIRRFMRKYIQDNGQGILPGM